MRFTHDELSAIGARATRALIEEEDATVAGLYKRLLDASVALDNAQQGTPPPNVVDDGFIQRLEQLRMAFHDFPLVDTPGQFVIEEVSDEGGDPDADVSGSVEVLPDDAAGTTEPARPDRRGDHQY